MWQYAHCHAIAAQYDDYFVANRLFQFDQQVLLSAFSPKGCQPSGLVADLGCGTGRALIPLVRLGFRGLAVDLSGHMLDVVRQKATREELPIQCVQANLVELHEVAENAVDHAMSLFSTLGMIRGRPHRREALSHARRILKPGGRFVLHVHNYWYNLHDPGGPWWVLKNMAQACVMRTVEVGDKFFSYRGVPNMFLHVFRPGELRGDLRAAGFHVLKWIPLDPRRHRQLAWRTMFSSWRANGWIVVCN